MQSRLERSCLVCAAYLALSLVVFVPGAALAMTASQLKAALAQSQASRERIVVIDIRSRTEFVAGRVPGSLNMPFAGLDRQPIPPFGRVVVVWDGIDYDVANQALSTLNTQQGVRAILLEGGYPAWTNPSVGGGQRVRDMVPKTLVYADLQKLIDEPDVTVLDLRDHDGEAELTEIAEVMPGAIVIAPNLHERDLMAIESQDKDADGLLERRLPSWLSFQGLNKAALTVLVDSGDGRRSELVARRLSAYGVQRVFVLTGGEMALRAKGEVSVVTRTGGELSGD